jgi:hypothetical protein
MNDSSFFFALVNCIKVGGPISYYTSLLKAAIGEKLEALLPNKPLCKDLANASLVKAPTRCGYNTSSITRNSIICFQTMKVYLIRELFTYTY